MAIRFYQERETGDLMFMFWQPGHVQHLEGCHTGIAHDASSLCWGGCCHAYLNRCKRLSGKRAASHPQYTTTFATRVEWMREEIQQRGIAVLPY